MTIKEYISKKLQAFSLTEAQLLDISAEQKIDLDDEAEDFTAEMLGKITLSALEEVLLAPRLKSVSESGFSMSFEYEDATRYYLFLCRKYGVTPNDVLLGGMSTITDKTSSW